MSPSMDRFHENWPTCRAEPVEEQEPQPHCEVCGERLESRHHIVCCDSCAELDTDAECERIHRVNGCVVRPSEVRLRTNGFVKIRGYWIAPGDGVLLSRKQAVEQLNKTIEAKAETLTRKAARE